MKGSYKINDELLNRYSVLMSDINISLHDIIITNMLGKGHDPSQNNTSWYARRKFANGITEYLFDTEIDGFIKALIESNQYESWLNKMHSDGFEICLKF